MFAFLDRYHEATRDQIIAKCFPGACGDADAIKTLDTLRRAGVIVAQTRRGITRYRLKD